MISPEVEWFMRRLTMPASTPARVASVAKGDALNQTGVADSTRALIMTSDTSRSATVMRPRFGCAEASASFNFWVVWFMLIP